MSDFSLPTETIRAIAEAAGLKLTDEQFADLVAAYRLYEPVLARLPRDWPYAAEPAHVFDPRSCMPKRDAAT
jgi:hypothetical protein